MHDEMNGTDETLSPEVAARLIDVPKELYPQIIEAGSEFTSRIQRKQSELAKIQKIQAFLQENEAKLIALQGFLGVMYKTYSGLTQVSGVLPNEE